jgi:hypothetical protein
MHVRKPNLDGRDLDPRRRHWTVYCGGDIESALFSAPRSGCGKQAIGDDYFPYDHHCARLSNARVGSGRFSLAYRVKREGRSWLSTSRRGRSGIPFLPSS